MHMLSRTNEASLPSSLCCCRGRDSAVWDLHRITLGENVLVQLTGVHLDEGFREAALGRVIPLLVHSFLLHSGTCLVRVIPMIVAVTMVMIVIVSVIVIVSMVVIMVVAAMCELAPGT